jgi:hypothetical protein
LAVLTAGPMHTAAEMPIVASLRKMASFRFRRRKRRPHLGETYEYPERLGGCEG